MKYVTNIPIPEKSKKKYDTLRKEYTIEKMGCKIPIGLIALEALAYVTDKIKTGEVKYQIVDKNIKIVENEAA